MIHIYIYIYIYTYIYILICISIELLQWIRIEGFPGLSADVGVRRLKRYRYRAFSGVQGFGDVVRGLGSLWFAGLLAASDLV